MHGRVEWNVTVFSANLRKLTKNKGNLFRIFTRTTSVTNADDYISLLPWFRDNCHLSKNIKFEECFIP